METKYMRRTICTISLLLLLAIPIYSQGTDPRFSSSFLPPLRKLLGVPPDTRISVSTTPDVPDKLSLKVYLAMGFDGRTRANFVKWIEKWNKTGGKKFGTLEIVADITQSDLVIARYVSQRKGIQLQRRTDTYSGTEMRDPHPAPNLNTAYSILILGFILEREPGGFKILRWYHDYAEDVMGADSDQDFDNTMHTVADSKGKADLKDAGDILRDELFKVLKSRSSPSPKK